MTLQGGLGVTGKLYVEERCRMNPVIGLDVAKGESQVQAYLDRREPYKSSFKVAHTQDGLKLFT